MRVPFIASAAGLCVFILGINYLGDSPEEQAASFRENYPTKDSCISGAAQRIAKCTTPNCYSGVNIFTQRCLDQGTGDKALFCDKTMLQYDSEGRDVFETHCEPHSPYRGECEKVLGYVGQYCSKIL